MDTTELALGLLSPWLNGEDVLAIVGCQPGMSSRHKVPGLDEDGLPKEPNLALRAYEWFDDDGAAGQWVAVRGDNPECRAVQFFRAIGTVGETVVVITPSRLAVATLRDAKSEMERAVSEVDMGPDNKESLGGVVRGIRKLVKSTAAEIVNSVRRPPLTERPEDASITVSFEAPRHELAGIEPWRQPMVPNLKHGPRMVQAHFTDGSWTRVQTTVEGAPLLTRF